MAVDLFSLVMNLKTTGVPTATAELKGVEAAGAKTAASLNGLTGSLDRAASASLNNTKGFRDLSGVYSSLNAEAKVTSAATQAVTQHLGGMGAVLTELGPVALGVGAGFLALGAIIKATAGPADAATIATLRLEGAAKLTGISFGFLQSQARMLESGFKLNVTQANEFVAELIKLTAKAGDVGQTSAALRAFLDIGAAQGMTASQTLTAVRQAILGIDEGTDKLFRKNPSVIYKEFAAQIGLTAGKLTDQQKAQALLNEAMQDGEKVRGSYAEFLKTAPGATSALAAATERLRAAIGSLFSPMRAWLANEAAGFLNWLSDVADRYRRISSVTPVSLTGFASKLGFALGGWGETPGGEVDPFRNIGHRAAPFDGGTKAADDAHIAALAEGFKLGTLTRAENAERLAIVKDLRAELAGANLEERNHLQTLINSLTPKLESAEKRLRALMVFFAGGAFATAPATLPGGGLNEPLSLRTGGEAADINRLVAPAAGGGGGRRGNAANAWLESIMQAGEQASQQFSQLGTNLGLTVANAFASAIGAAIKGKNPFKAFGNAVLAGLGSIFTQMGQALIAYGVTMLKLLPFLTNIFTSGPAAIAAGVALTALGITLGSLATGGGGGSGGGGSSAPRDRTTEIHLTSDGAGGFTAPKSAAGHQFTIIGVNDPQVQRSVKELIRNADRRNL